MMVRAKRAVAIAIGVVSVLVAGACVDAGATATADGDTTAGGEQVSSVDTEVLAYDEADVVTITLDGDTADAHTDGNAHTDGDAVTIDGSTVTIADEGVYALSGTLTDGRVVIDAADDDDVTIVLDGVDITNNDGAAIAALNADNVAIVLADDSDNRLTDGAVYSFPDAETDEPNAALYSSADLVIGGTGELTVTGNFNDGIAGKDDLAIQSGAITVTAVDDGIRGKDSVVVTDGTITVDAGGDGIKADDAEVGSVRIDGGTLDLVAGDDGVQAAIDVVVTDGVVTIDAGRASGTGRALQSDVSVVVSGGVIDAVAADDGIHSNDTVIVAGGDITVAAGDDGVHGDLAVTVDGGTITITDAFEGIESEVITVNDGIITINSDDDGLNVASAEAAAAATPGATAAPEETAAPGATNGRPRGRGPGGVEQVGEHYIHINGGTISITISGELAEQGDGIDANGHVEMTGGLVVVSGPTDTRNSAIDYSGGTFVMTGGTFVGTNVDGRNSEGVGLGSTQASLYVTTGSTNDAGTVVHIESADGEGLVTFEPANAFSVVVFSSPDLVDGSAYDVYLGGSVTGDSTTGLHDDSTYTAGDLVGTATAAVSG